jgi:hypothetical protein
MSYVMVCLCETSEACALRQRNLRKKSGNVSLLFCWHDKKSSSIVRYAWKPWKLTRNFSLSCVHDAIDLSGNLAYQLVAAFLRDMMNDLARVISPPSDEAITAS